MLFFLSRILTQSLSRLVYKATKSQKAAISFLAVLFFPGVIIHELSHLLTAAILFVRVGEMEFMPKMHGNEVKLGSVQIAKTDPLRRAIIGVAPVFVGMTIILTLMSVIARNEAISSLEIAALHFIPLAMTIPNWVIWAIVIYIIFVVSNTMFSSKKDLEGTIEVLTILLIVVSALFLIGFRLPQSILDYFLSPMAVETVGKITVLILMPLVVDILIIGGARVLMNK